MRFVYPRRMFVRRTIFLKPSKPVNSGSKRPPSECFYEAMISLPEPASVPVTHQPPLELGIASFIGTRERPCQSSRSPNAPAGPALPAHLVEADVLGLLTEALTAQVEVVLADQTGGVLADTAIETPTLATKLPCIFRPSIFEVERGVHSWGVRTRCESPCRSFADASSRRFRETWLRCFDMPKAAG